MEYPYQLVTFLSSEPQIGEPVYGGLQGWYSQITLKRRFRLQDITEHELLNRLETYCSSTRSFTVHTGKLMQPSRIPVKTIQIQQSSELIAFHKDFIAMMGDMLQSRFPERDGDNYLPHITVEYDNKMVLDPAEFTHKDFVIKKVWLLKDIVSEDSQAYRAFKLHN